MIEAGWPEIDELDPRFSHFPKDNVLKFDVAMNNVSLYDY